MKNYCLPFIVLIALLSSCTPARQVAESSPAKKSTPLFQTWVDPNEDVSEEKEVVAESTPSEVKPAAKEESLDDAYARFRKDNPAKVREAQAAPLPVQVEETKVAAKETYRVAAPQPLPNKTETKAEVIRLYVDSDRPIVVDVIRGKPENMPAKETFSSKKKVESPAIDPEVLKTAPYVKKEEAPKENADDFMMALMEDELEIAKEDLKATRSSEAQIEIPQPAPKKDSRYVEVYLSGTQSIKIDEERLRQWEKKIVDARMGIESPTRLPRWLLQGLEWVTNASKEEPMRSQTIMPLYRELEFRGHLDDVNLNQMTPVQVVRKIRILVDELKASDGQLSMR
ncbi:MAG: hypothetical protein R8P61_34220 [Bacteroidia bacterium]|nr:hypothetical protein [Bacteroidia bacterium]